MSEKLITLSGAEVKVTFSGGNAWLRNDGAAVVYAAKTAGVAAGADGVISIPAGCSAPVYGANGTVFLLGSGSVQLIGSDYATNPFVGDSFGGGADIMANAAEMVTLDGLQGGVPFSDITVSGKNLITEVLSSALGGNSTDGFRITNNPYCRSFVQKILPNTTYTVKRYDGGNRFRIILFNEYPTNTADTTANQILNATTTPNEWTFTTGSDHLWFALTTHNGATDKTIVEPIVQLEYGDTATEYEQPIIGQEITLTVNDTEYTVTPDSNPYTVPNDIRQQEGINSVSVSAGEVSVTGAKRNAAVKKIWNKLDELTAAIIVSNGETTE